MAITYAQLATALIETTENEEATFAYNIPVFVRHAEQRIYADANIPATRRMLSGNCNANSAYMTVPSGFLSPLTFALVQSNSHSFLLQKDVSFIREAYPNAATTGVPLYYAVFNESQFLLGPTPGSSYSVEVQYMGFPSSIVDTGTSWLGNNFETVLLYGSLINAYVFMKGEEDVLKMYQERYTDALGLLKRLGGAAFKDEYRTGAL